MKTPITGLPRLHLMTLAYRAVPHSPGKPIHGGKFGGRFLLTRGRQSMSGLVPASCYVIDAETDVAVGIGADEAKALADARSSLDVYRPADVAAFIKQKEVEWYAARPKEPSIPKRRRAIFDASKGKCHYCETPLAFEGAWHVEHRKPKSRGGSDESANLAAACGLCNLRKKDKTEAEFCEQFGLVLKADSAAQELDDGADYFQAQGSLAAARINAA